MAVQPRVIFTQFSSVDSTEFRPWIEHLDRVLGKLSPVRRDVADPTVWQLVTANNRELARSAGLFDGFGSARDAAKATVASLAKAVPHSVVDDRKGLHGWYLSIEGAPDVVCARWYLADRERTQAVAVAVGALAGATLGEGARVAVDRSSNGLAERGASRP
jgi:hypothetical protein